MGNIRTGYLVIIRWFEIIWNIDKPEFFDPSKQYPMIVNFYEKSSNGLHTHRDLNPGRSSINYSFYTSRGYCSFQPHSYLSWCRRRYFNCVIPGITSLIEKSFTDKNNITGKDFGEGGMSCIFGYKTNILKAGSQEHLLLTW